MNRHILLVALILSISIFGNVLAKKGSQKNQTAVVQNQPKDDEREEELILLPEILDRLEDESSSDTDLGPELPPTSDSDSKDKFDEGEPNLLSIEDDSDGLDNIFDPKYNNDEIEAGSDTDDTDTNSLPAGDVDGEIDMSNIEIDGEYHIFDDAPCAGIQVPIGKRSVRVSVLNLFNADVAMLTDGQFTNCSQLTSFECPENATFCRKQSLDSESDADIELEQEACGVENAYIYVLPINDSFALSYKVRVEDIGQPLCDDNSEAQIAQNSQDEDEKVPGLISTENSESSDEELEEALKDLEDMDESSDLEINEDQIMEGTIEVDGKVHPFDTDLCTVITIPMNKQPVNIDIDDIFNCAEVMITDVKIPNCNVLRQFRCPKNNTFCQIQSLDIPEPIQVTSCDTDIAYMYILPEEWEGVVTYEANITALNNDTCGSTQDSIVPVPVVADESDESDESEKSDESDESDDQTPADSSNSTISANTTDSTTTTPSTEGSTDNQSETSTTGDNGDSSTAAPSQGIADTGSKSNGGTIVLIIFGSMFAIFMAVVCIYRRQFKKNRVELFNPPTWCPNCLFPRVPPRMMSGNNVTGYGQIDYNEYEPPVL